MCEHAGEERCGVVGLHPCRLIGGQRKRSRMSLAKSEGSKSAQDLPHLVDHVQLVPSVMCAVVEPPAYSLLTFGVTHIPASFISDRKIAASHHRHDPQHLFVIDHHAVGLGQSRSEVLMHVLRRTPPVSRSQKRSDHVALDWPRPEQRDISDDVLESLRGELAQQFPLAR